MKIALAQTNPLVGDIAGNTDKILAFIARAKEARADLVIFPELSIVGYAPRDLLLKEGFVNANMKALDRIVAAADGIAVVVGFVQPNESGVGRALFNAAAVCANRAIVNVHHKSLLPTYDVFDESRYFEPDPTVRITRVPLGGREVRLGVSICEDLWNDAQFSDRRLYGHDPISEIARAGADLLINISASPYSQGKQKFRVDLFGRQVAQQRLALAYVNQIGGNDHLIFDGASLYFAPDGRPIAQAKAFAEDLLIVDTETPQACRLEAYPSEVGEVYEALVLGTRDYVHKCNFTDVVMGLSGGIDSAVTCAIAVATLGAPHVHGVALPSRYSSPHSLADAHQLAINLGIELREIPIEPPHRAMEQVLAPVFAGRAPDVTEENVQARLRGNILMALSNKFGWLLLTTGNKSELSVGYCTLYGDMCGGLAVISDVPKTLVYRLAHYINEQAARALIPASTITKPPSAELKPNQTDQDTIPPYELLDAILHRYVELEQSAAQIIAQGFDPNVVREIVRGVDRSEYKRQQAALGLKVTSRAFGVGRRMPIAARINFD
jgi:NAD+ synthetase